jgi:hypothetical protein
MSDVLFTIGHMANPAELLYATLRQWNLHPNNDPRVPAANKPSPAKHRELVSNRDEALRKHEIVLGYIAEVRELLDTYELMTGTDVEEFRHELPNWTAMVLSTTTVGNRRNSSTPVRCGGSRP